MGFDSGEAAEFNSGLAIIYQLDGVEKALAQASYDLDYEKHYRLLLIYFKILHQFMSASERERHMEMWNKIKENLNIIRAGRNGKYSKRVNVNIVDEFDYWEMELRDTKKKHGLGMPAKDARYTGTNR